MASGGRPSSKRAGQEKSCLTEKDVRLGRGIWRKSADEPDLGLTIFRELFKQFPDTESFFLHFKTDNKELIENRGFRSHITERVVPKLQEVFDNLDKPEELNDIMTKMGVYHAKLKVSTRNVDNMLNVIIDALKSVMGEAMRPNEELAFRNCLAKAFAILNDVIVKYEKEHAGADPKSNPAPGTRRGNVEH